ncbi:MAG TPA: creatininase family protein [Pseudonocardiaceae bacterium]|nr:creatininase family protein [Pseudonocardiaceae bacterium]
MTELADLTRDQVADLAPRSVLVLPVGAVEQHGPHLPLITDTMIVCTVAQRAVSALGDRVPTVLAPTLPFGHSEHHLFACAASLKPATLTAVLSDLVESLHTSGFTRFFLINGHGGNDETVRSVSKSIVNRLPVAVATANYWQLGGPGVPPRDGADVPGHAGWWETCLAMATRPEIVHTERFTAEPLGPRGLHSYEPAPGLNVQRHGEWARSGGTTDPAAGADGMIGAAIIQAKVDGLVDALVRFEELTGSSR